MRKLLLESKSRIMTGGAWFFGFWISGIICPFTWPFITLPTVWLGKVFSIAFNLKTDFFYRSLNNSLALDSDFLMLADFTKIVVTCFIFYVVIIIFSKWIHSDSKITDKSVTTETESETETK